MIARATPVTEPKPHSEIHGVGKADSYDCHVGDRRRTDTPKPVTLKPVGVTDDGRSLLLGRRAGAKSGGFKLAIDQALVDALDAARSAMDDAARVAESVAPPTPAPIPAPVVERASSKLTPREIQALLRRGIAPMTIAKRAGVDVAWVERFQGPILWERAGMSTRAQRATLRKARRGPSGAPLGESVTASLRARGVALEGAATHWDATKRPKKNAWVVTCTFTQRARELKASWEYDPASDEVVALDKLAADIGWIQPARRRRAS